MDTYYVDYADTSYGLSDTAGLTGLIAGLGIFFYLISLAISIFMIVTMWKIFTKAGKPGWASLIPIYNIYIMCEIAGVKWWYILLLFVPIAQIYAMFVIFDGIAKKFGKTTGFTIGMILLPYIFLPILAFGKTSVYNDESAPVAPQQTPEQPAAAHQAQQPVTEAVAPVEPVVAVAPAPVAEPIVGATPVAQAPVEPVVPVTPTEPVTAATQVEPIEPVAPIVPTPAVDQVEPLSEAAPVAPVEPVVAVAPAPVAEPIVDVSPVAQAPVEPVAPVTPTEPVTPVVSAPVVDQVETIEEPAPANPTPVEPVEPVAPAPIEEPVAPLQQEISMEPEKHQSLWSGNNTNNNQS